MAAPIIARTLQASIKTAFEMAAELRHPYVTLEHLVVALLDDPSANQALVACGVDCKRLEAQLLEFIDENVDSVDEETDPNPQQTMAVERVLHRAAIHALNSESPLIDGARVLVEVFEEPNSHAVYWLERLGATGLALKQHVSHSDNKRHSVRRKRTEPAEPPEETPSPEDPLETYAVNLVEQAAMGQIDPLIGRNAELERTVHVLCRRRKNNPLFVGEPGVGKTALAEGLALRIFEGKVPEALRSAVVYSLDMGALLAGTKYRGEFEERLKDVIKQVQAIPKAIVFIDEIHTVMGAGMTTGGSLDASNILKPALASGKLRCMGSTTHRDYKASFDHDRAFARRFQKIDIKEPSVGETVEILEGLKPHYESHHLVAYDAGALEAAAKLSDKYLRELQLPDKAIDVMDEAGAMDQLRPETDRTGKVSVQDVEMVVSRMANVPAHSVSASDRDHLKDLAEQLRKVIFGQNSAIDRVVSAIQLSRAGLRDPDKPIGSFLFSGPTGVGKTETAKQLARAMGVEFLRYDMSEYSEKHTVSRLIGAPPGYVGFDQGGLLTDAVRKNPSSVVVLDEIEKAHPDLYNVLLQIMDHATLTDNTGRKADFRNVVLIMTTNAGALEMSGRDIGFGAGASADPERAKTAIERTFPPEFRNRLDAWIRFERLQPEVVLAIVDKELGLLRAMLAEKGVSLVLSEESRQWLATHGFDAAMGARPLARLVEDKLKRPLAESLLFGRLANGGTVNIEIRKDEPALTYDD
ncbi:MAG: ATP-dependent Clp protease ATP-binding subunit ClpA [Myxococcales bacterium]|nr:ATP-dependent Clp protease ATP-binding subunit ClpA [Myxococcales bacterium]MCB9708637.1 ATP-dependent Clp protease ATP-binding subunit ClpA [Myxococcales bacterium]